MLGRGLARGFSNPERAARHIPRFLAPFKQPGGYANLLDHILALDARHTVQRSGRLGTLGIPVGLAWGDADPFQPWATAERRKRDTPGAVLERIAGISHDSPTDAPAQVAKAIMAHLGRSPSR